MTSKQLYIRILLLLIGIRIIMVIGITQGFPHIHDKGWFIYIVDWYEKEFFRLAKSLAEFHPIISLSCLGYPLFLVTFIWIFKASVIEDILLSVVLFNSILLFGISIFLVAAIAKKLSNENKKVALLSAGLWVILPYLVHLAVLFNPHLACLDIAQKRTSYLMWTTFVDDPLFTFLVMLGVYTFVLSSKYKDKIFYSILVGSFFGFAALINPLTSVVIGISFITAFLFMKRIRSFIYAAITFVMFGIPQLIYNWYFNGSPFKLLSLGSDRNLFFNGRLIPLFSLSNILFFINRIKARFDIVTLFFIIIFVLMVVLSIIYILIKRREAKILIIWIAPYLLFVFSYSRSYYSILELTVTILPATIIMFSLILVDTFDYLLVKYKYESH